MELQDLTYRAATTWSRMAKRGEIGGVPMLCDISIEEHDGRAYVVWREHGDLVGCFRVRNDGKLKCLIRVPAELKRVRP